MAHQLIAKLLMEEGAAIQRGLSRLSMGDSEYPDYNIQVCQDKARLVSSYPEDIART